MEARGEEEEVTEMADGLRLAAWWLRMVVQLFYIRRSIYASLLAPRVESNQTAYRTPIGSCHTNDNSGAHHGHQSHWCGTLYYCTPALSPSPHRAGEDCSQGDLLLDQEVVRQV
jgi:hypothetical protein